MKSGIYHWPSETIEKSALIKKLEELCRENPEIEHIYENVPISKRTDTMTSSINQSNGTTASEEQTIRRDSNPLVNIKVVKEGELKVRKGSTILSSLIKSTCQQLIPSFINNCFLHRKWIEIVCLR